MAGNTVGARWAVDDPARPRAVFTRETSGPGVLGFSADLTRLAGAAEDEDGVTIWPW